MRRAPTLWAADPAAQRGKSEPSRSAVFEPSHGVFRAESLSESRRFSSRVPFRVTALFVSQTLFGPTIVARLGDHRGGQQLGDQGARTKARTRSPRAQRALISACAGGLMQAADRGRAVLPSSAPPSLPTPPPRATHRWSHCPLESKIHPDSWGRLCLPIPAKGTDDWRD